MILFDMDYPTIFRQMFADKSSRSEYILIIVVDSAYNRDPYNYLRRGFSIRKQSA